MKKCNWTDRPASCFDDFLESRSYSEKSRKSYKSVFCSFLEFMYKCGETLKTVNERILQEWLINLGVRHQTEIRYLGLMSSVFEEMVNQEIIVENFASSLIVKKTKLKRGKTGKRLPVALDEKEFDLLMLEINKPGVLPRRRIVVLILLGCGLRESELCDLRTQDIHLDAEQPYLRVIGKGDKEREVPIPEEICRDMAHYQDEIPTLTACFVGVERRGEWVPFSPSGIFRMVQELMRKAGIIKHRMSPHVLRHTYATRQLQAGVPIALLKMWMGHKSLTTTMIYEHSVAARSSVRPKF